MLAEIYILRLETIARMLASSLTTAPITVRFVPIVLPIS